MDENPQEKMEQKSDCNQSQDVTSIPVEEGTHVQYNMIANANGTKQHPQPTSDPLDPLNWSKFRKNSILAIVMLKYEYSPSASGH